MQPLYDGPMYNIFTARRQATPDAHSSRPRGSHRLALALTGLAAAMVLLLVPSLASADTGSTLTVLGTSDVSDSGLAQNVIAPAFKAEFPQFTFKYVGSATGTAIQNAESGNGGASALIVHAASLENSFVGGGFSFNQYGNAIFTNDFVLTGPTADPAAVDPGAANNVAQAFATIAAAGAANTATYISRGGTTTASGTTVEEHAIWALMQSSGLTPAGVFLCTVSAADGGGASPTIAAFSGQACPDSGTVLPADAPSWYAINTGASQGANVTATNACTVPTYTIPANTCYSLTDRGTFNNLAGSAATAGSNTITNLKIVSQNNSASAPGGPNELVNYFHVYIINPAKPGQTVNLPAAQDFVSLLTSPSFQASLPTYLNNTNAGGPTVFNGTASPSLTATFSATAVPTGKTVTVTGQLTNKEPGYPALGNEPVTVDQIAGTVPVAVATGTTNATGGYSVTFAPTSSGSYQVSTGQIAKVEDATLNPVYGDILSPASSPATQLSITGAATITKTTTSTGSVNVSGALLPAVPDGNGVVTLLAKQQGSNNAFSVIGSQTLAQGQTSYAVSGARKGGKWTVQVQYSDPGALTTATSLTKNVTVPASSVAVKFQKLAVKNGKLTLTGSVGQAPTVTGRKVTLYALTTGKVNKTTTKKSGKKTKKAVDAIAAKSSGATFKKVTTVNLKKGKSTYTIKHSLKRGFRYALQLKYTGKNQTSTYSGYKYLSVH
jgi:tungstate transport system substrate-binding protein